MDWGDQLDDLALFRIAESDRRLQDQAAEVLDSLIFKPARDGDFRQFSKHLRQIFEAVKRFQITASDSLVYGLDLRTLDMPEYHFFIAFERLRRKPIFLEKWPSRSDVRKLALQSWALHELDKKGYSIKFDSDLPPEEEDLVQNEVRKLVRRLPKRIWENTGLQRLKKDGLGRPKGSIRKDQKKRTFSRGKM
jgi:hypothetical protein